jgi:hypothetical protein
MFYTCGNRADTNPAAPYSAVKQFWYSTPKVLGFEYPFTKFYAKLPLTPWKPWTACFMTHLSTRVSL